MSVSWQGFGSLSALSVSRGSLAAPLFPVRTRCSSLAGCQELSKEPLRVESGSNVVSLTRTEKNEMKRKDFVSGKDGQERDEEQEQEEEGISISRIQVPRQKYIPVPKAELLDAIVPMMFESQQEDDDDAQQFIRLSSCLDSILHAEHKGILEEMRADYSFAHSVGKGEINNENSASSDEKFVANGNESEYARDDINGVQSIERHGEDDNELDKTISFIHGLDLRNLLGSSDRNVKKDSDGGSSVAVATRFQRAFMKLLYDAQFEELSARDLMLTSALNTDYLLTLPIYVDWKRASESNAIIFRRGYASERQKGLLIVEKLDYIQSKLLRGIFFIISKPLGKLGAWMNEALKTAMQTQEVQEWSKRMKLWLKELLVFWQSFLYSEHVSDDLSAERQLSDRELPIWLAAQRAVSRYEGILSPVGPRGRLLRKLLSWIGLIPPTPETSFELDSSSNASEPYKRPISLSRISLSDIWRPASKKYCGNDLWKRFKTSISILLSQSVLQSVILVSGRLGPVVGQGGLGPLASKFDIEWEPAFQELILLYTKEDGQSDAENKAEVPSLQLKIYERIPIPDLPVIFPHKKLSFRIIDTVRLDAATIVGLLAYFINYKFEDVLSSPFRSAIFLDVVAISALIIYVTRVVLGYKQTWDRYQLLVNKTLYEKTLASGFGSVHFLLDASEQQQYKEAILAYAILLKAEKGQVTCRQTVGDKCERFMYDAFKVKVEMPIDKAISTLVRLGLATETPVDGRDRLQAVPCPKAYEGLKERWNSLIR